MNLLFKTTLTIFTSSIVLLLFSCKTQRNSASSEIQPNGICFRDSIIETDSLICIGKPCAVLFSMTDNEIDSLKTAFGEEDFYTIMDDYNWYVSEAMAYLEERNIPVVSTHNRKVQFIFAEGNKEIIYQSPESGKMLLFDGINKLLPTYPIVIQAACDSLFGSFPVR